jgi:GTP-binding protein HflX
MIKAIVLFPVINININKQSIHDKLVETCNLAKAISLKVVHKESFFLKKPDPSKLIRKGKIEYIKELINTLNFDSKKNIIIFSIDISPIQQRNLERTYNIKVLDKTSLILEIFGKRALSREGSIQVELAHLNWQKSRLVRSWTHLERQRGGYGFLGGPGESQIELDKRMINKRIKQLKFMIEKIKKTRHMQYINREKTKVPVVALLGYTNAGKSTLFNALTKLNVKAKNKLFETLDTKVSYFYLENTKKVYISDTVGFISDLPTLLVEAFKSTLDEVKKADLLVHVRDSCSKNTETEKEDVLKVLSQLNINPNSSDGPLMIEVMNKIDKAPANIKENLYNIRNLTFISALTGEGIKLLKNKIDKTLIKKLKSN